MAGKRNQSMFSAIQSLRQGVDSPLSGRAARALIDFGAMIEVWQQAKESTPVGPLLDDVITRTGFNTYLNDGTQEGEDRLENVKELSTLAYNYGESGLSDFLTETSLVADADTRTDDSNAAVLLTLHAAKGLEFPVVFIAGLEEGILPHQRSIDDPEQMDEERRLIYVGVTRAKDMLFLTWAFRRSAYGDSIRSMPSRFLNEIPGTSRLGRHYLNTAHRVRSAMGTVAQRLGKHLLRHGSLVIPPRARHAIRVDSVCITPSSAMVL